MIENIGGMEKQAHSMNKIFKLEMNFLIENSMQKSLKK